MPSMGPSGSQLLISRDGYWQVPITEQNKAKTAFRTSSGQLFEFNQVPFGLCNAPATFSRLMDRVLAGLHWETCLFYLYDIIVFSSTWEEHLARLRQVFERLRHANLKLGADKCTFAAKEVNYLGHRVTEEGLLLAPGSHSGDSSSQNGHRSPLLPGSSRLLPALCKELCSHRCSFTCLDPEGCGLPLERGMSDRLRPTQDPVDHKPHHCLPGF